MRLVSICSNAMATWSRATCFSAAALLIATGSSNGAEWQTPRVVLPVQCMHHEQGACYIVSMDFGEEGDKLTRNRSQLVVFEDGKPLGPARSPHALIRTQGRGRYSHWMRSSLYLSASDNSDPRVNGRTYEVASSNRRSTLGGLERFPSVARQYVETISSSQHRYTIDVGGTLDMENTRTLTTNNCYVAFQNNVSLTIENVGETPVINPRVVINDRGDWHTFESLLAEFTRGAKTPQERVYFIWQHMRQNLYHETPLFGNAEPHDPVRLLNIFGFNLCDDAGNAGCSLFHHAGFVGSKNRSLNGHVQCEAYVDGHLQFMDIDMDCFYLDRENERPVSGDACAHDHDLVRRELNYGPEVASFTSSDAPAALFGPDDRLNDARLRGHKIDYTLRPGECVVFRWDNRGKYCSENRQRAHLPKYFGNSQFIYRPRFDGKSLERDAAVVRDLSAESDEGDSTQLVSRSSEGNLIYRIDVPYPVCGATVEGRFSGRVADDQCRIAFSPDQKIWQTVWAVTGAGRHMACVSLDNVLNLHQSPARYHYFVRIDLKNAPNDGRTSLSDLTLTTDVLAAPTSLPRLTTGANHVAFQDETPGLHRVRITHRWRESDAVQPLPAIKAPTSPAQDAIVTDSIVTLTWPAVKDADRYHLQVSRRADFAFPYRPCLDVIIPTTSWSVPYTGVFSPNTGYYWRLRCRDYWGVWGRWSEPWQFTWDGPRVPIDVRFTKRDGTIVLQWNPNPRGPRPVKYAVYGSNEKGFSIHKNEHNVPGRGTAPANFLLETTETSIVVVSPTLTAPNANKTFYRVVAIDAHGTQSGCSDYAELPHPYIFSNPPKTAAIGKPYRYAVQSLQSLGDYQCRQNPDLTEKQYAYRFWDIEENRFEMRSGPDWLTLNPKTGILSGSPGEGDLGTTQVILKVTNQFGRKATQQFQLTITR